ncbi:MAG TPA: FAD-binding protein [Rugosimonospora sp.]|nr:FAD-binding protein [Rugosimonospora sp.]
MDEAPVGSGDHGIPAVADVVVVGGGGAGPAAALAALEGGARRVVLVEERGKFGGNAAFATGIFACESPVQRALMVDVPADDVFRQAMRWHHFDRVNPRLLRAYINKTGDTVRWLTGKGIEFRIGVEYKMSYEQPPTWHIPVRDNSRAGGDISRFVVVVRRLVELVTESGGTALLQTRCTGLRVDGAGQVCGVEVERGGVRTVIACRSVVLATGGFHGNDELLRQYFPFVAENFGGFRVPMAGSGIGLAGAAGAAVEDFATLIRETCASSDEPKEYCLGPATREPYTVWVNRLGRRFIDETVGFHLQTGSNPLLLQPGKEGFALYDSRMVRSVDEDGWLLPRAPMDRPVTLRPHLESAAAKGEWVATGGRWRDVAAFVGARPEALEATVSEYNECCRGGYDATFLKDRRYLRPLVEPPFYAIRFRPMIIETAGPVRVDEWLRALDRDFQPVPGLYVAGALASGWQGHDYCGEYLFGTALGFALNSGRIAGEHAARLVTAPAGAAV